ncbi:MAG: RHS repeat-associated core domain-containing protein, partial [Desulfocapsaceae bacterium]|nr:RHS repeat-associated core domain-containing protein [Desulfocapsaceae bacterium]
SYFIHRQILLKRSLLRDFISGGANRLPPFFYIDKRLVAMKSESGNYFYYHFDKNGNTVALTDSSGNTAATYTYTPFGELLQTTGTLTNPFTYVGAYGVMDDGEGLYYMKNRYYNASTGKFIQKDPLRFAAGTNVTRTATTIP